MFCHLVGLAPVTVIHRPQHQPGAAKGGGGGWLAGPIDHLLDVAVTPPPLQLQQRVAGAGQPVTTRPPQARCLLFQAQAAYDDRHLD